VQDNRSKILIEFQILREDRKEVCNIIPSFRETQFPISGKTLHTWGDIGGRKEGKGKRTVEIRGMLAGHRLESPPLTEALLIKVF